MKDFTNTTANVGQKNVAIDSLVQTSASKAYIIGAEPGRELPVGVQNASYQGQDAASIRVAVDDAELESYVASAGSVVEVVELPASAAARAKLLAEWTQKIAKKNKAGLLPLLLLPLAACGGSDAPAPTFVVTESDEAGRDDDDRCRQQSVDREHGVDTKFFARNDESVLNKSGALRAKQNSAVERFGKGSTMSQHTILSGREGNKKEVLSKLISIWEAKNARVAARTGSFGFMAATLAACGGSGGSSDGESPTPAADFAASLDVGTGVATVGGVLAFLKNTAGVLDVFETSSIATATAADGLLDEPTPVNVAEGVVVTGLSSIVLEDGVVLVSSVDEIDGTAVSGTGDLWLLIGTEGAPADHGLVALNVDITGDLTFDMPSDTDSIELSAATVIDLNGGNLIVSDGTVKASLATLRDIGDIVINSNLEMTYAQFSEVLNAGKSVSGSGNLTVTVANDDEAAALFDLVGAKAGAVDGTVNFSVTDGTTSQTVDVNSIIDSKLEYLAARFAIELETAITDLVGDASADGDTLEKLEGLIDGLDTTLSTLTAGTPAAYDTLLEIANTLGTITASDGTTPTSVAAALDALQANVGDLTTTVAEKISAEIDLIVGDASAAGDTLEKLEGLIDGLDTTLSTLTAGTPAAYDTLLEIANTLGTITASDGTTPTSVAAALDALQANVGDLTTTVAEKISAEIDLIVGDASAAGDTLEKLEGLIDGLDTTLSTLTAGTPAAYDTLLEIANTLGTITASDGTTPTSVAAALDALQANVGDLTTTVAEKISAEIDLIVGDASAAGDTLEKLEGLIDGLDTTLSTLTAGTPAAYDTLLEIANTLGTITASDGTTPTSVAAALDALQANVGDLTTTVAEKISAEIDLIVGDASAAGDTLEKLEGLIDGLDTTLSTLTAGTPAAYDTLLEIANTLGTITASDGTTPTSVAAALDALQANVGDLTTTVAEKISAEIDLIVGDASAAGDTLEKLEGLIDGLDTTLSTLTAGTPAAYDTLLEIANTLGTITQLDGITATTVEAALNALQADVDALLNGTYSSGALSESSALLLARDPGDLLYADSIQVTGVTTFSEAVSILRITGDAPVTFDSVSMHYTQVNALPIGDSDTITAVTISGLIATGHSALIDLSAYPAGTAITFTGADGDETIIVPDQGSGVTSLSGGAGADTFILVGSAGARTMNATDSIDGGDGTSDTLHIVGTVDTSAMTLTGIENLVFEAGSPASITMSTTQLAALKSISFTGATTVGGVAVNPVVNVVVPAGASTAVTTDATLTVTGSIKLNVSTDVTAVTLPPAVVFNEVASDDGGAASVTFTGAITVEAALNADADDLLAPGLFHIVDTAAAIEAATAAGQLATLATAASITTQDGNGAAEVPEISVTQASSLRTLLSAGNGYDVADSAAALVAEYADNGNAAGSVLGDAVAISTGDVGAADLSVQDLSDLGTIAATITNGYNIVDTAGVIQGIVDAGDTDGFIAGATAITADPAVSLVQALNLQNNYADVDSYSITDTAQAIVDDADLSVYAKASSISATTSELSLTDATDLEALVAAETVDAATYTVSADATAVLAIGNAAAIDAAYPNATAFALTAAEIGADAALGEAAQIAALSLANATVTYGVSDTAANIFADDDGTAVFATGVEALLQNAVAIEVTGADLTVAQATLLAGTGVQTLTYDFADASEAIFDGNAFLAGVEALIGGATNVTVTGQLTVDQALLVLGQNATPTFTIGAGDGDLGTLTVNQATQLLAALPAVDGNGDPIVYTYDINDTAANLVADLNEAEPGAKEALLAGATAVTVGDGATTVANIEALVTAGVAIGDITFSLSDDAANLVSGLDAIAEVAEPAEGAPAEDVAAYQAYLAAVAAQNAKIALLDNATAVTVGDGATTVANIEALVTAGVAIGDITFSLSDDAANLVSGLDAIAEVAEPAEGAPAEDVAAYQAYLAAVAAQNAKIALLDNATAVTVGDGATTVANIEALVTAGVAIGDITFSLSDDAANLVSGLDAIAEVAEPAEGAPAEDVAAYQAYLAAVAAQNAKIALLDNATAVTVGDGATTVANIEALVTAGVAIGDITFSLSDDAANLVADLNEAEPGAKEALLAAATAVTVGGDATTVANIEALVTAGVAIGDITFSLSDDAANLVADLNEAEPGAKEALLAGATAVTVDDGATTVANIEALVTAGVAIGDITFSLSDDAANLVSGLDAIAEVAEPAEGAPAEDVAAYQAYLAAVAAQNAKIALLDNATAVTVGGDATTVANIEALVTAGVAIGDITFSLSDDAANLVSGLDAIAEVAEPAEGAPAEDVAAYQAYLAAVAAQNAKIALLDNATAVTVGDGATTVANIEALVTAGVAIGDITFSLSDDAANLVSGLDAIAEVAEPAEGAPAEDVAAYQAYLAAVAAQNAKIALLDNATAVTVGDGATTVANIEALVTAGVAIGDITFSLSDDAANLVSGLDAIAEVAEPAEGAPAEDVAAYQAYLAAVAAQNAKIALLDNATAVTVGDGATTVANIEALVTAGVAIGDITFSLSDDAANLVADLNEAEPGAKEALLAAATAVTVGGDATTVANIEALVTAGVAIGDITFSLSDDAANLVADLNEAEPGAKEALLAGATAVTVDDGATTVANIEALVTAGVAIGDITFSLSDDAANLVSGLDAIAEVAEPAEGAPAEDVAAYQAYLAAVAAQNAKIALLDNATAVTVGGDATTVANIEALVTAGVAIGDITFSLSDDAANLVSGLDAIAEVAEPAEGAPAEDVAAYQAYLAAVAAQNAKIALLDNATAVTVGDGATTVANIEALVTAGVAIGDITFSLSDDAANLVSGLDAIAEVAEPAEGAPAEDVAAYQAYLAAVAAQNAKIALLDNATAVTVGDGATTVANIEALVTAGVAIGDITFSLSDDAANLVSGLDAIAEVAEPAEGAPAEDVAAYQAYLAAVAAQNAKIALLDNATAVTVGDGATTVANIEALVTAGVAIGDITFSLSDDAANLVADLNEAEPGAKEALLAAATAVTVGGDATTVANIEALVTAGVAIGDITFSLSDDAANLVADLNEAEPGAKEALLAGATAVTVDDGATTVANIEALVTAGVAIGDITFSLSDDAANLVSGLDAIAEVAEPAEGAPAEDVAAYQAYLAAVAAQNAKIALLDNATAVTVGGDATTVANIEALVTAGVAIGDITFSLSDDAANLVSGLDAIAEVAEPAEGAPAEDVAAYQAYLAAVAAQNAKIALLDNATAVTVGDGATTVANIEALVTAGVAIGDITFSLSDDAANLVSGLDAIAEVAEPAEGAPAEDVAAYQAYLAAVAAQNAKIALLDNATAVTVGDGATTVANIEALVTAGVAIGDITFSLSDDAATIKTELSDGDTAGALANATLVTATGTADADDANFAALSTDMVIDAAAGNDDISGGTGNDIINAGAGADIVFGGGGTDTFRIDVADIADGTTLGSANLFGDFESGDTIDLKDFTFKSVSSGTTVTADYGTDNDVFTVAAKDLSAAANSDTTLLYTVNSAVANFNTQGSIDTAVSEVTNAASLLVFSEAKNVSVLIQVVGSDGNDVALFHYDEDGTNGIQAGELDLLGVFIGSDPLVAADII